MDVVPLLRAIVGCHFSVLWLVVGASVTNLLWGSGPGAIAGCNCSVLWLGGKVTTNFGGVDGAIAGSHCSVLWFEGGIFSLH